jgi:hypothetical protein
MKKLHSLIKVTASVSLACGIAAAAAGPALAASPNEAYGILAGPPLNIGPIGLATYPGTSPTTVASATVGSLATTGVITDTADAVSASSTVNNLGVTLSNLASLSAATVTSSCSFDPNTGQVTGNATITNGGVTILGGSPITLAANPTKNENVLGLGRIATITLDKQTTAPDGTLTVTAIAITLLGGQTLDIATSVCNQATLAPAPALPGISLPIGVGLAGLLGVGGVGYFLSRRRRVAAQSA